MIVSPKVGGPKLAGGKRMAADAQLDGAPSVIFDAVAVVASEQGAADLVRHKPAVDWLSDAFAHLKAIAHTSEAVPVLQKAGVEQDDFVVPVSEAATIVANLSERNWAREKKTWLPK